MVLQVKKAKLENLTSILQKKHAGDTNFLRLKLFSKKTKCDLPVWVKRIISNHINWPTDRNKTTLHVCTLGIFREIFGVYLLKSMFCKRQVSISFSSVSN